MDRIEIEIMAPGGDVSLLPSLLDEYDELRTDVAEEIASMIRLNRKRGDGKTISSTSWRLADVAVTVHHREKQMEGGDTA